MNFWDKVTGNDMTREFQIFEKRAENLPKEYKLVWEEIKKNIWEHSNFTGRNLIVIFDEAITMLEETANEGLNINDVVGNDVEKFSYDLIGKDRVNALRDKWRRQLNNNIKKKLGQ
ncbi:MAG: DUF1048 domain-containing protein [Sarcina sp.]